MSLMQLEARLIQVGWELGVQNQSHILEQAAVICMGIEEVKNFLVINKKI
jgi:hypothetical protein